MEWRRIGDKGADLELHFDGAEGIGYWLNVDRREVREGEDYDMAVPLSYDDMVALHSFLGHALYGGGKP